MVPRWKKVQSDPTLIFLSENWREASPVQTQLIPSGWNNFAARQGKFLRFCATRYYVQNNIFRFCHTTLELIATQRYGTWRCHLLSFDWGFVLCVSPFLTSRGDGGGGFMFTDVDESWCDICCLASCGDAGVPSSASLVLRITWC